jgi:hypothetical protein
MQGAATVDLTFILVMPWAATMMGRMLIMNVRSGCSCESIRTGQRRRDNSRELGEHEDRDQRARKGGHGSQTRHMEPAATDRSLRRCGLIVNAIDAD